MEIKRNSLDTKLYVFGIENQPPPSNSVTTLNFNFGIEAKQVCGYTDWSSTMATLPTKLLSGKYWEKVSEDIKKDVADAAMAVTGALPSMLACNVSPTFCSVMNNAKLLAQFEFGFAIKACDVLEGLGDKLVFDEKLKDCMGYNDSTSDQKPGQRREKCIKEIAGNPDVSNSIKFKYKEDFLESLCPGELTSKKSVFEHANSKTYSRKETTCKFLEEIFPGVEISGSSRIIRAGTFQGSIEKRIKTEINDTITDILAAVGDVRVERLNSPGKRPDQITEILRTKWKNKKTQANPKISYINDNENGDGDFLIPPEQIFQFSLLLKDGVTAQEAYKKHGSSFRVVVDRASRSAANIKMLDRLSETLNTVQMGCVGNSKLQNPMAKENCQYLISHFQSEIALLNTKIQTERELIRSQEEITKLVNQELSNNSEKRPKHNESLDVRDDGASNVVP